jgi:protein transport protein SEC24
LLAGSSVDNSFPIPQAIFRSISPFIPASHSIFTQFQLPFGFIINPVAPVALPQFDRSQSDLVIRCKKCRAFGSGFVTVVSPQKWLCPICGRENPSPDPSIDLTAAPELQHFAYEFKASAMFNHFSDVSPRFVFCVDVSAEGWDSNFTSRVLHSIRASIPRLSDDVEMCFVTFDRVVSVFIGNQNRLFVIPDSKNVCLPIYGKSAFTTNKDRIIGLIDVLLKPGPRVPGQSFAVACKIASQLVEGRCGVVVMCAFGLPSAGESKLEVREFRQHLGQPEEARIMRLPVGDAFYRDLATSVTESGSSVQLFLGGAGYVDLATVGLVCGLTYGRVSYFPNYNDALDGIQLHTELHRVITTDYIFDCLLSFHHPPKSVRLYKIHSMLSMKPKWAYFPSLSSDQSLALEAEVASDIKQPPIFSTTLIYTNSQRERMIRVYSWSLAPTTELHSIVNSIDLVVAAALTVKNGCRVVLSAHPAHGLYAYKQYLLELFRLFPAGFPARLKPLAHLCHTFRRSIVFSSSPDVDVDARMADLINIRTMNGIDILLWLHPRAIPWDDPGATVPLTTFTLTSYPVLVVHMVNRIVLWVGEKADDAVTQIFGGEFGAEVPELNNEVNAAVRRIVQDCWAISRRFLPVQLVRRDDQRFGILGRYLVESSELVDNVYEKWYRGMCSALAQLKAKNHG